MLFSVVSGDGSNLPSIYADVRSIDDANASRSSGLVHIQIGTGGHNIKRDYQCWPQQQPPMTAKRSGSVTGYARLTVEPNRRHLVFQMLSIDHNGCGNLVNLAINLEKKTILADVGGGGGGVLHHTVAFLSERFAQFAFLSRLLHLVSADSCAHVRMTPHFKRCDGQSKLCSEQLVAASEKSGGTPLRMSHTVIDEFVIPSRVQSKKGAVEHESKTDLADEKERLVAKQDAIEEELQKVHTAELILELEDALSTNETTHKQAHPSRHTNTTRTFKH